MSPMSTMSPSNIYRSKYRAHTQSGLGFEFPGKRNEHSLVGKLRLARLVLLKTCSSIFRKVSKTVRTRNSREPNPWSSYGCLWALGTLKEDVKTFGLWI